MWPPSPMKGPKRKRYSDISSYLDPSYNRVPDIDAALKESASVIYPDKDANEIARAFRGDGDVPIAAISPPGTLDRTPMRVPTVADLNPPMLGQGNPQAIPPTEAQRIAATQPPAGKPTLGQVLGSPVMAQALIAFGQAFAGKDNPVNAIGNFGMTLSQNNAERAYFQKLMAGEDPATALNDPSVMGISAEGRYRAQAAYGQKLEQRRADERLELEKQGMDLRSREFKATLTQREVGNTQENTRIELSRFKLMFDMATTRYNIDFAADNEEYRRSMNNWEKERRTEFDKLERESIIVRNEYTRALTERARRKGGDGEGGDGNSLVKLARLQTTLDNIDDSLTRKHQQMESANSIAGSEYEDDDVVGLRMRDASQRQLEQLPREIARLERRKAELNKLLDDELGLPGEEDVDVGGEETTTTTTTSTLDSLAPDDKRMLETMRGDDASAKVAADAALRKGLISQAEYGRWMQAYNNKQRSKRTKTVDRGKYK